MSAAAPGAAWQRPELVGEFLDGRQALLPLIDVQEELVRRTFQRHRHEVSSFLDLGAGDGAMSALVQSVLPHAQAVLVDFSEPMLARAQQRLGEPGGRWRSLRADLSDAGWRAGLDGAPFGAAVSSFAIHHLPSERKQALFGEIFDLLEPGGMFVNMDVVTVRGPLAGLFEEQMAANAGELERSRGGDEHARHRAESQLLDDNDDDQPDSAESQLRWLGEAGFADVELHFKWAEGAIFGAVKPS